jgi:putative SOS response-associated peptidase YedK
VPGEKIPYFIHRPDHGLFAFAGLWEHWLGADGSELETAAIITTEPNRFIAQIYTRMPAVIQPENYAQWLDARNVAAEAALQFLKPAPDEYFVFEPTIIARNAPPPGPKAQLSLF